MVRGVNLFNLILESNNKGRMVNLENQAQPSLPEQNHFQPVDIYETTLHPGSLCAVLWAMRRSKKKKKEREGKCQKTSELRAEKKSRQLLHFFLVLGFSNFLESLGLFAQVDGEAIHVEVLERRVHALSGRELTLVEDLLVLHPLK